jgi:hypothetical protein
MTPIKLLILCLCFGSLSQGQSLKATTPIGASFRASAEDVLDCLDGLSLVDTLPDQIYWPQSLKCRPMVRRLERSASNPEEIALAETLHSLQSKITACHIGGGGGQACKEEQDVRARAIQQGTLRAPSSVGS